MRYKFLFCVILMPTLFIAIFVTIYNDYMLLDRFFESSVVEPWPPVHPVVDRLKLVAPPPVDPVSPGTRDDWQRVERDLKLTFPADFKALVATYGTGAWGQQIFVNSPIHQPFPPGEDDPRSAFADHQSMHVRWSRKLRHDFPGVYAHVVCRDHDEPGQPLDLWPEPGGVLIVGGTDHGNKLAWRTCGQPDQWTVLAAFPRKDKFIEYKMGIAEFIHLVLTQPDTAGEFWGVVDGPPVFHRHDPLAKKAD